MADAHDEHMAIVRAADADTIDNVLFQDALQGSEPKVPWKRGHNLSSQSVHLLRFLCKINYLFTRGKLWETKGTYGHFMLRLCCIPLAFNQGCMFAQYHHGGQPCLGTCCVSSLSSYTHGMVASRKLGAPISALTTSSDVCWLVSTTGPSWSVRWSKPSCRGLRLSVRCPPCFS